MSAESSLTFGARMVATAPGPDRTVLLDFGVWPPAVRQVPGLFASSLARLSDGSALTVARHHHANPYRLYALDLTTGEVAARPVGGDCPEPCALHAVGDGVIVVPGGDLSRTHWRPSWWRDGALTPIDLPPPEAAATTEHEGRRYAMPPRMGAVDVAPLPSGDALMVWFERLHRVSGVAATPLAPDHLFAAWSALREGRHPGLDDRGRALMVIGERFVAVDPTGAIELASPGSERVHGAAPGPDGLWLLTCDESLHVVSLRERWVAEVDLRPMRLAPKHALFMPKAAWVAARGAVLVAHSHDAWEFDLDAILQAKRVSLEKHGAKLIAARRSQWSRKVKAAGGVASPLDALSPHTRGGALVSHPTYGVGAVTHASETSSARGCTISATVVFEDRTRSFVYMGARWDERPWTLG